MSKEMTSLERVRMTLRHLEPDRAPLFLLPTLHGAKELGLSIKDYFSTPENVVEGQLRLRTKYQHDCYTSFYYGPLEIEAWGGDVIFFENGPPNSATPFISGSKDIENLTPPDVMSSPPLLKVLKTTEMLQAKAGGEVPILGVVMSPFSLPVMQMGFDKYIELMFEREDLFERLMRANEEFCVNWANAQVAAGATAICYFDPVASTTITSREIYQRTGFDIARRVISKIKAPVATHLASGNCLPVVDLIAQTGTVGIGVSVKEDLEVVKGACRKKLTVIGNLNSITMRLWGAEETEAIVKEALAKAGPGGGFILSDNHGEIPYLVPEEVLMSISGAVRKWGQYPLDWIEDYER